MGVLRLTLNSELLRTKFGSHVKWSGFIFLIFRSMHKYSNDFDRFLQKDILTLNSSCMQKRFKIRPGKFHIDDEALQRSHTHYLRLAAPYTISNN